MQMMDFLEPLSKFLLIPLTLVFIFPMRYGRKQSILLTIVYSIVSIVILESLTRQIFIRGWSYHTFIVGIFAAALLWSVMFVKETWQLTVPYICFLITFMVSSRILSERLTHIQSLAILIAFTLLALASLLMVYYHADQFSCITRSQYIIMLLTPLATFISLNLWRAVASRGYFNTRLFLWVALCHYAMNLLLYFLMMSAIMEYRNVVEMSIQKQIREMELEEQRINRGLVEQCYYIRHQFKNVCMHWQQLLRKGHYDVLMKALEHYIGEDLSYNEMVSTGNHLVNVFLSEKIREAQSEGIRIYTRILLSENMGVSEDDLIVMLSCLLRDACAEERRLTKEMREIQIEMHVDKGIMEIKLRCRKDNEHNNPETGWQKERLAGSVWREISIVHSIVRKYQGCLRTSQDHDYEIAWIVL